MATVSVTIIYQTYKRVAAFYQDSIYTTKPVLYIETKSITWMLISLQNIKIKAFFRNIPFLFIIWFQV